jgi:hypothetical protein
MNELAPCFAGADFEGDRVGSVDFPENGHKLKCKIKGSIVQQGGENMANANCISARMIDLIVGGVLLAIGILFFIGAVTVLPVVGFYVGIPFVLISPFFLFARADKTCHIK